MYTSVSTWVLRIWFFRPEAVPELQVKRAVGWDGQPNSQACASTRVERNSIGQISWMVGELDEAVRRVARKEESCRQ